MSRVISAAACIAAVSFAGCGDDHRPQAFKGVFAAHGGAPHAAAVSAGADKPVVVADAAAAKRVRRVHRVRREVRHDNADENRRIPTPSELAQFRRRSNLSAPELVTGAFRGTTDQILQWVAAKWTLPVNLVRAVAYAESSWHMSTVGDNGQSFGLMQVKGSAHPGTYPLSRKSTAFNVDYWAATTRDYYEGRNTWLNKYERGRDYRAGDLWGSVGAWWAGAWYTDGAKAYIGRVKRIMAEKPWLRHGF